MACCCRHQAGRHQHIQSGRLLADGSSEFGIGLNGFIDKTKVAAWNIENPLHEVLPVLDVAGEPGPGVTSDADEEILIYLPFTEFVRIRAVSIIGPGGPTNPSIVNFYVNSLEGSQGFDAVANMRPAETLNLVDVAAQDEILYLLDAAKFMSVGNLTVFIKHSFGGESSTVRRIAFYGESTKLPTERKVVANVVYELRANPADHKSGEEDKKKDLVL